MDFGSSPIRKSVMRLRVQHPSCGPGTWPGPRTGDRVGKMPAEAALRRIGHDGRCDGNHCVAMVIAAAAASGTG